MQRIVSTEEMEPLDPIYTQDEDLLKLWIDAHKLKRIEGTWYKDGPCVVTGGLSHKCTLVHAHYDSPVYGHPGIMKTYQLVS